MRNYKGFKNSRVRTDSNILYIASFLSATKNTHSKMEMIQ